MNRTISTPVGLILILVSAVAFLAIFLHSYKSYKEVATSDVSVQLQPRSASASACRLRAFMGHADIKGWYADKNSQKVIQIAKDDLLKLPTNKNDKIQVIDLTPDAEKKLANSSENKPGELTITGYALPCDDEVSLASIDYKDKIFHPYINN
jgi:hypothetical protein